MKLSLTSPIKLLVPLMAVGMLVLYMVPWFPMSDAIGRHISDDSLTLWSEWEMVINYQAGWVRRAFIGALVHVGWDEASSINVYPIIGLLGMVLAQLLLVLALFTICNNIAITSILFISSPFLGWYLVWDFEGFVFRKDFFIYSALVIHSLLVFRFERSLQRDSVVIAMVFLATLIHEMTVFTLAAHWLIYRRGTLKNAIAIRKPEPMEWGLLLVGLIGISSALVKLSSSDITAICAVLPEALRTTCTTSGPMLSIIKPSSYFFSDPNTSPLNSLGTWAALSLLWLGNIALFFRIFSFFRTANVPFIVGVLFSLITVMPLMVLAIDWGRWLVLGFVVFLAIYVASIDKKIMNRINDSQRWALLVSGGVLLVLALLVRIPHCCTIHSKMLFTPLLEQVDWLGSLNK